MYSKFRIYFQRITSFKKIYFKTKKIFPQNIKNLQKINDDLSLIFKSFGTKKIENVLNVCYGSIF